MPPRGLPGGDPLLKGADWQKVRRYWIAKRDPCHVCGEPIDYRPEAGRRSLDVGHIVSRDQAKAMGWTRAQINALSNTRPECRTCSRGAGARMATAKRVGKGVVRPIECDEW